MPILRLLLLLALLSFLAACGQAPEPTTLSVAEAAAARSLEPAHAPASAVELAVADLPPEGRATLALIKRGGPFAYSRDGIVFGNREGLLPTQSRGYYREYTMPTPGSRGRGARRIISGGGGGEYWYTADHYRSFKRIRE
ncbi:MAG: ribonuclease domain-containing protein [Gallionellaceae bacterium]|nr:ribonuclease domain-containing protein [Gallionellaceae bacterium]